MHYHIFTVFVVCSKLLFIFLPFSSAVYLILVLKLLFINIMDYLHYKIVNTKDSDQNDRTIKLTIIKWIAVATRVDVLTNCFQQIFHSAKYQPNIWPLQKKNCLSRHLSRN